MREMKDSGIEWIGDIPADWGLQKGKYLFEQRNLRGNQHELQLLSPTQKYGVIPQSLYESLTGMNPVKLSESADLMSLKTIHKGDFCISLRSFQGGFEYSEYEGVVSPAYQVFYPIVSVADGYYKYLFKENGFIEKMNSYTMTLRDGKNIAFSDFGNTYIPYPPVEQQIAIASFLDGKCAEVDALSANVQAQIDTLEQYKRSVITETVTKGLDPGVQMRDSGIEWIGKIPAGWTMGRIKDCFSVTLGKMFQSSPESVSDTLENYACASNLKWHGYNPEIKRTMWFSPSEKREYLLKDGDVLIMEGGATAGTTCMYHGENAPCYMQNSVNRCRSLFGYPNKLLYYWLYHVYHCGYIESISNKATFMHYTKEKIEATALTIPTPQEQLYIVDYLDAKCAEIDSIITQKQQQLSTLDAYKKSLIYEYVTGKKEVFSNDD